MNQWAMVAKSLQGLYYCVLLGVCAALLAWFVPGPASYLTMAAGLGVFLAQLSCVVQGPPEMGGRPQLQMYVLLTIVSQLLSMMYTYKIKHDFGFLMSTPGAVMGGLIGLIGFGAAMISLLGLANMSDGLNRSDIGSQFMTLIYMVGAAFVATFILAKVMPILLLAGIIAVPLFAIIFVVIYSRAIRDLWKAALTQSEGAREL
ncbi:MAG: hypothetical protein KF760_19505 [Candidatus Eremiobacteraeota bacterium]|nr:hypothetical protein [Candidatus Eremiobacteraeota bacterium]MCW5868757.1 hypothetical protein [Candidatus Eremiobacteraeota bacterium]